MILAKPCRSRRLRLHLVLAALAATLAACATPVGVERMDPRSVHRDLANSALSSDTPSAPTLELLTRLGLREVFKEDPDAAIATLHAQLVSAWDRDRLFALAELSFLQGWRMRSQGRALAAAVYAYAFLFAGDPAPELDPFDPRVLVARSLYNRSVTLAFGVPGTTEVRIESGRHTLPFGVLDVTVAPDAKRWIGWNLDRFVSAADFRVRGLDNRYRHPGIGAALNARLGEPIGAIPPSAEHIPKRLAVPVTAVLHFDGVREQIVAGRLQGRLELYAEDSRPDLVLNGRRVPLEVERSSALAYMLEGSPIWDFGFVGFRLGDYLPGGQADQLFMMRPYTPGRIPLVLVHGTFSSPATWAQLVNELSNDPIVVSHYQLWLFLYNTGNPIAFSGGTLVQLLREVVAKLDPQGSDPALQRMVVVGHSQGGLLTKLTAVDSGNAFWANASNRPFSEAKLEPESRELLERSLFYTPLPFVKRVVFMSTPHHGSYLSDFNVVSLLSRLVKMPVTLSKLTVDLARNGSDEILLRKLDRMPTSLDNMASRNPFLRTLSELPIAPGIRANSIIAVRGDGPLEDGSDGVVRYPSAHIDGVESELVVRSGHSVQEKPEAIQELRRILLEHAAGP